MKMTHIDPEKRMIITLQDDQIRPTLRKINIDIITFHHLMSLMVDNGLKKSLIRAIRNAPNDEQVNAMINER